jgi:hypothetical protein
MRVTAPALAARFGWLDQYRALQAGSGRRRAPQRLLARAIQGYLENGERRTENVVSLQTATLRGLDGCNRRSRAARGWSCAGKAHGRVG